MTTAAHLRTDLAALYRREAGWLRRHLVRCGVTVENAEDAVQETFAVALSALGELRDPRATRSYLATIARRIAWRTVSHHAETATDVESLTTLTGADTTGGHDHRSDAEDLLAHVTAVAGNSIAAFIANLATGRTAQELKLSPAAARRARARAASALAGTEWARRRSLSISVVPDRATPQIRAQIERLPFRQREVLTRHIYSGMTPAQIAWHLNISANSARVSLHSARTALGRQLGVDGDDLTALLLSCPRTPISPDTTSRYEGESTSRVLPGPWSSGRTVTPPLRSTGTPEISTPDCRTA